MGKSKKRLIITILAIVCICVIALYYYNTHIPNGLTEQEYKIAQKVLEITEQYIDCDISKDEAYDSINELYDRYKKIQSPDNIYSYAIGVDILCISSSILCDSDIVEHRDDLKKELK